MSDTPRTDAAVLHYDNGAGEMAPFVETDFARQLERELAEATARTEKAEAERDALRKALELARPYVRASSMQMYDGGQGADMRKTARDRLEVIDTALARTAQASELVRRQMERATETAKLAQQDKSRTCGECAHYGDPSLACGSVRPFEVHEGCFHPRADAQKGTT